jgi:hypothetical protein
MVARRTDEEHRAATVLELFFDLCFVVAVAQAAGELHDLVSEDHGSPGLRRDDARLRVRRRGAARHLPPGACPRDGAGGGDDGRGYDSRGPPHAGQSVTTQTRVGSVVLGGTFWLSWKTFSGSDVVLTAASRSHVAPSSGSGSRIPPFADPSAYGCQHSGLLLLQRSGDKYFLLTGGWDTDHGDWWSFPSVPRSASSSRRRVSFP